MDLAQHKRELCYFKSKQAYLFSFSGTQKEEIKNCSGHFFHVIILNRECNFSDSKHMKGNIKASYNFQMSSEIVRLLKSFCARNWFYVLGTSIKALKV